MILCFVTKHKSLIFIIVIFIIVIFSIISATFSTKMKLRMLKHSVQLLVFLVIICDQTDLSCVDRVFIFKVRGLANLSFLLYLGEVEPGILPYKKLCVCCVIG